MKAGVLKETWPGETRVALVPGVVAGLVKSGVEIVIESGAGAFAGFPDALYAEKGASLGSRDQVLAGAQPALEDVAQERLHNGMPAQPMMALERLGSQRNGNGLISGVHA